MYRRSLEMQDAQQEQDSTFIGRVTKLPVVRSAMDSTFDIYQKAKDYNSLVGMALTSAERTALIASERAKPVIAKFETQIVFVDVLACKTLDKLEQSMPIVKKTPEEIMLNSKKMYEDTIRKPTLDQINSVKEYGMGKVNALKDYGVQKATTLAATKYGQAVTSAVDDMLLRVDVYVDDYLPSKFEEGQCPDIKLDPSIDTLEKANLLSKKLQQRMICHGQIQFKSAKAKADELLSNLILIAKMINFKDGNKVIFETASAAQARLLAMYQEIERNVENGEEMSSKDKLFLVAKQLTIQLHQNYQKVSSTLKMLPAKFQPGVQQVQTYVLDVYDQFTNAKSFDEVSSVVLSQMQDGARKLQMIYSQAYDYALQSKAISWMTKTNEREVVSNGSVLPRAENSQRDDGTTETSNDSESPNTIDESSQTTAQYHEQDQSHQSLDDDVQSESTSEENLRKPNDENYHTNY